MNTTPTLHPPSTPSPVGSSSFHTRVGWWAIPATVMVLLPCAHGRGDDDPARSRLPLVHIDTDDGTAITSIERYVNGRIRIDAEGCDDPFGRPCQPLGAVPTRVRGRGNTTWGYVKKPFRLRLDEAADLLGIGPERDWVLLANYIDPGALRNALAFELGRRLGLPFTPHDRHVNVVLNGRPLGLYLLTEHTEVGPQRVVTDDDAGYLVEYDDYPQDGEEIFSTAILDLPLKIRAPDVEKLRGADRDAAVSRVRGLFEHFERTVAAADGPGDYSAEVDGATLIDWFLVHEITHNYEPLHPKSCFFHGGADGRIAAGPLWDFDYAYDYEAASDEVLGLREALWFPHLFRDPAFRQAVKDRWNAVKADHVDSLPAHLDRLAAAIATDVHHDLRIFPPDDEVRFAPDTAALRQWLTKRIMALDAAIRAL